MITCRCPKCRGVIESKSCDFGQQVQCIHCSHEWTLDTVDLARYTIPKRIRVSVRNSTGNPIHDAEVKVEYNYPVASVFTDHEGIVVITDDMIKKGLSDYISLDGIMDHRGEDYECQKYIHLSIGSIKRSLDLSNNKEDIELKIQV